MYNIANNIINLLLTHGQLGQAMHKSDFSKMTWILITIMVFLAPSENLYTNFRVIPEHF